MADPNPPDIAATSTVALTHEEANASLAGMVSVHGHFDGPGCPVCRAEDAFRVALGSADVEVEVALSSVEAREAVDCLYFMGGTCEETGTAQPDLVALLASAIGKLRAASAG